MTIVYFHWLHRRMIDRLVVRTHERRTRDRRDFGKGRLTWVNFHRCQAWEFMKTLEGNELTLFKHCWCNQDRPLNEILVKGGVFERTHCLAEGDGVCDMTWTTGEGEAQAIRDRG